MLVTSAQHVSLAPSEVFLFSVRCDVKQENFPRANTGCATRSGTQMTYYVYIIIIIVEEHLPPRNKLNITVMSMDLLKHQ